MTGQIGDDRGSRDRRRPWRPPGRGPARRRPRRVARRAHPGRGPRLAGSTAAAASTIPGTQRVEDSSERAARAPGAQVRRRIGAPPAPAGERRGQARRSRPSNEPPPHPRAVEDGGAAPAAPARRRRRAPAHRRPRPRSRLARARQRGAAGTPLRVQANGAMPAGRPPRRDPSGAWRRRSTFASPASASAFASGPTPAPLTRRDDVDGGPRDPIGR